MITEDNSATISAEKRISDKLENTTRITAILYTTALFAFFVTDELKSLFFKYLAKFFFPLFVVFELLLLGMNFLDAYLSPEAKGSKWITALAGIAKATLIVIGVFVAAVAAIAPYLFVAANIITCVIDLVKSVYFCWKALFLKYKIYDAKKEDQDTLITKNLIKENFAAARQHFYQAAMAFACGAGILAAMVFTGGWFAKITTTAVIITFAVSGIIFLAKTIAKISAVQRAGAYIASTAVYQYLAKTGEFLREITNKIGNNSRNTPSPESRALPRTESSSIITAYTGSVESDKTYQNTNKIPLKPWVSGDLLFSHKRAEEKVAKMPDQLFDQPNTTREKERQLAHTKAVNWLVIEIKNKRQQLGDPSITSQLVPYKKPSYLESCFDNSLQKINTLVILQDFFEREEARTHQGLNGISYNGNFSEFLQTIISRNEKSYRTFFKAHSEVKDIAMAAEAIVNKWPEFYSLKCMAPIVSSSSFA